MGHCSGLVCVSGPSSCERERWAAEKASAVFVPSCEAGGAFSSKQCQEGEQCWCVDPTGRELPGSRQHGDSLVCCEYTGATSCPSQPTSSDAENRSHVTPPPPSLLQIQVLLTVYLSVAWLCRSSSPVLLILHSRPPLAELWPPVSPSSSPSRTWCQWRQI